LGEAESEIAAEQFAAVASDRPVDRRTQAQHGRNRRDGNDEAEPEQAKTAQAAAQIAKR